MRARRLYPVCLLCTLCLMTNAPADEFTWDNSSGDSLWRTEENWDLNRLPADGDAIYVNWLGDPTEVIIDADTDGKCNSITISNDNVGGQGYVHVHMTGGTLLAGNLIRIGRKELGMFTIDDGEITCSALQLGRKDPSKGILYINGGTVTCTTNTRVPRGGSQGSELHLNGGVLYTDGIVMNDPTDDLSGTNGWTDITEGVMILTDAEDQTEKIKNYVQNGWITAYGVKSGELLEDGRLALVQMDYDVTNPGMTTVWATASNPVQARSPRPADGATVQLVEAKAVNWTPGEFAASNDVYFGTDEDAVANADVSDTTGVYRARQSASGYILPEALEWGATYFWRIDAVEADGTIHKGPVWTFTVADYLLVDDFESYTDDDADGEAIWQTWIDGFGAPENGSQVGYLIPPYAEQTIVHEGTQSMPLSYDNYPGGPMYSEAVKTLSYPRDWTEQGVEELSLWFRGYTTYVGGLTEDPPGTYTVTGSGTDIWDASDQFHFAFKQASGATVIQAQVLSISHTDDWTKAGVMVRDSLDPNSAHAMVAVTPANGVWFGYRTMTGQTSNSVKVENLTAPQWVKLECSAGGLVRAYYSADGNTWNALGTPLAVMLNDPVYIGMALTSHNPDAVAEATFSDVSFPNTDVDPEWTDQDVGISANAPQPMYVAVADGAGASAVVYHDDPNAAVIDTWTEWVIPLQTLADQGVDLTDIDRIAIGLGDKGDMTSSGGSGKMYFDDIHIYRPRLAPTE
jgi:hypothetical protein